MKHKKSKYPTIDEVIFDLKEHKKEVSPKEKTEEAKFKKLKNMMKKERK